MLIKVIMCGLPDCSLGFHRLIISLRLLPLAHVLPVSAPSLHTFVVRSLFSFLGVCNFQICAVIITHHYGSNRDMHEKPVSVRKRRMRRARRRRGRKEREGGEKSTVEGKKKCDS